ncbi:MAG: histidinol dehydrogenase [Anaerolineales bacterium]
MLFQIYDVPTARARILQRKPIDTLPVPQSLLDNLAQTFGEPLTPAQAVERILADVRTRGDSALREWSTKFDDFSPEEFRVPESHLHAALQSLPEKERAALEESARRIEAFHRKQPLTSWLTQELGGTLGQFIRPIRRVGVYVPGGSAPLPSSVLMSVIPARVAGVEQIVVVAPPQRGQNGIAPIILAACAVARVREVYCIGGAQAIGALAYGTPEIPRVQKIFGPGNLFVTLAKRHVYGMVGIDGLAGPTETVVIADETARPAWVAADLLAQAEHDPLASAILLTPSYRLAEAVQHEINRQIENLPRAQIIAAALQAQGGAVITRDLQEAAELANEYAAEHLCLTVAAPWLLAEKIENAGGIFLGEHSFEVLGDYIAGPSHVMPTGGSARFASPLNVWDFIHIISLVALNQSTAQQLSPLAAQIARAEGLEAHARAADFRA